MVSGFVLVKDLSIVVIKGLEQRLHPALIPLLSNLNWFTSSYLYILLSGILSHQRSTLHRG